MGIEMKLREGEHRIRTANQKGSSLLACLEIRLNDEGELTARFAGRNAATATNDVWWSDRGIWDLSDHNDWSDDIVEIVGRWLAFNV